MYNLRYGWDSFPFEIKHHWDSYHLYMSRFYCSLAPCWNRVLHLNLCIITHNSPPAEDGSVWPKLVHPLSSTRSIEKRKRRIRKETAQRLEEDIRVPEHSEWKRIWVNMFLRTSIDLAPSPARGVVGGGRARNRPCGLRWVGEEAPARWPHAERARKLLQELSLSPPPRPVGPETAATSCHRGHLRGLKAAKPDARIFLPGSLIWWSPTPTCPTSSSSSPGAAWPCSQPPCQQHYRAPPPLFLQRPSFLPSSSCSSFLWGDELKLQRQS